MTRLRLDPGCLRRLRSAATFSALPFAVAVAAAACGIVETENDDPPTGAVELNGDLVGQQVFPSDNWWNVDASSAPVDPSSDAYLAFIGRGRTLHPDFGPPPFGIPYLVVGQDQPLVTVDFVLYGDESDHGAPGRPAGYPIPDDARTEPNHIEGGAPGGGSSGDRHLIIVDRDRWLLFETWATSWNGARGRWEAGSGAAFDMKKNDRRPEGWTSADAAGLAILPGLVRADEVLGPDEIRHAFRVTVRTTNGYVWPASHRAGSRQGARPMGARLRLRADVDLTPYPPELQKVFRAMQRHGLIVADNGSDMFVQGTMDERWDNDVLNPAFRSLTAGDFEVIELGWRR
jgi:hypothetical protein